MTEIKTNEYKRGEVYLRKIEDISVLYVIGSYRVAGQAVTAYPLATKKNSFSPIYILQDNYDGTINENIAVCDLPEIVPVNQFVKYVTTITENDMENFTKAWKEQLGIS